MWLYVENSEVGMNTAINLDRVQAIVANGSAIANWVEFRYSSLDKDDDDLDYDKETVMCASEEAADALVGLVMSAIESETPVLKIAHEALRWHWCV
jgi:hypothetical protein